MEQVAAIMAPNGESLEEDVGVRWPPRQKLTPSTYATFDPLVDTFGMKT